MNAVQLTAALSVAALSLAACSDNDRKGGDARLCIPFQGAANAPAAAPGVAQAPAIDDCLHRWGYALADSEGSADEVAAAVVAACMPVLTQWNQQSMNLAAAGAAPPPAEAPSLVTGEPTNPTAERYRYAENRALFYVIQGRAGECPAPPMKAGAMSADTRG
ncbi:hypothetical protein [Phenylobacterium sp.]|uniref:hypothetical protein n=1 Tax=Phenylobacterium sp. TaxID=1871053 RepID=UPI00378491C0